MPYETQKSRPGQIAAPRPTKWSAYSYATSTATLTVLAFIAASLYVPDATAEESQSSCGKPLSSRLKKVPLTSMAIKTPLYVMQSSGRFSRLDLSRQVWTHISDHEFDDTASVVPSANGRWISYSGTRKGYSSTQYWIYDRRTKVDRMVLEHPAWGGSIPEFSPDNKFIVIAANYDSRWGSDTGAGIVLLDTATWHPAMLKLPTLIPKKNAWASTRWSKDGAELLIMVRSMDVTNQLEYFSYRPSTKAVEKISGRYDRKSYDHVYSRGGRDIPLFDTVSPRSIAGLTSEYSPSGKWRAFLGPESRDRTYALKVTGPNGVAKEVAFGRYDDCEGKTLAITGWIDEQHLVYRDRSVNYFVFDTSTGNKADLFKDSEPTDVFTW